MHRRFIFSACALIGTALLIPKIALGQGTVTIFGALTDPSGASVEGARVIVTNAETGRARETRSAGDGSFVLPDLGVGTYELTVEAAGFKTFSLRSIKVQVDENRRVDVHLEIGSLNESVVVQANVAQVETRSSALREVVDSARIVELPLDGRNPLQLQYLLPGSGRVSAGGGGQAENDVVAINGSRPNSNNYTLDGADNHDPFFNSPSVFPNPDALDEFSLQSSNYSADQGRNAGAVMNAVTKAGTNSFHGTLFEFLRNQDLDARSFFATAVSPFKRNQFGGTLGGPIWRNKTFFFGSYQGTRVVSSPGVQTPTVFTAAQRGGDFSAVKAIIDPATKAAFPNNRIPSSSLNPAALNFMNTFVPLPNSPNGIFAFASGATINDDQAVVRVDHNLSARNQLSGRFLFERNDTEQVPTLTTLPGFLALIKDKNWNASISDTHSFSPVLVNQFTFGFNDIVRNQLPIIPSAKSWVDFGSGFVRAAPGPIAYDTEINGYFNAESRYALNQYRKGFQYSDNLAWTKGLHTLKMGGDLRQPVVDQNQNFQTDPQVIFGANFSGLAIADFLLGREQSFTEGSPNAGRPRTIESDLFLQDDWKASKRLTLNLGLRWDPFLPYHDLNVALSQLRLGEQSTVYPTAPSGYVFPGDPGVPDATIPARWNNWAPRFGFALDPAGNGRTSIRGGYGIFYSDIRGQALNNLSSNEPFAISLNVNQPSGGLNTPYSDTGNPFPFQPPASTAERQAFKFIVPLTTVTQFDPDFRNARVQQWNFSVQQQVFSDWIVTGAYVGSGANHLFITNQVNPAIYGKAGVNTNARRLLAPTFTSVLSMLSVGNSSYNALQLSANKRLQHGLTVLLNYTWSKSIDEGSDDGSAPSNPFNIAGNRGLSDFNLKHRFVTSAVWKIPTLQNSGALVRALAGGWELNGILTLQTGSPFSIVSGVDNSQSGVNADRADVTGNPRIDGDRSKAQMLAQYFNAAVFMSNAKGTFGNAGRNILTGPGTANLDFGVVKSVRIFDRLSTQIRAESFNLLNHANFVNPNNNLSSTTFGRITSAGSPRVVQLALKMTF